MASDISYYRRRASEERTAALHTRHPGARAAHVDMAIRYEGIVRDIAARDRQAERESANTGTLA